MGRRHGSCGITPPPPSTCLAACRALVILGHITEMPCSHLPAQVPFPICLHGCPSAKASAARPSAGSGWTGKGDDVEVDEEHEDVEVGNGILCHAVHLRA